MSTTTNKPNQPRSAMHASASSNASTIAAEKLQQAGQHFVAEPASDLFGVLKDYAHDKPDVAALWCFGLGLLVGWKIRG